MDNSTLASNLDKAIKALTTIATLEPPTQLANDLGVNEDELLVHALRMLADKTLKEITQTKGV